MQAVGYLDELGANLFNVDFEIGSLLATGLNFSV